MMAGTPSGRLFPSPFAIHTRLTACGSYLPFCSCSHSRVNRLSARAANLDTDTPSMPPPPRRDSTRFHATSRLCFRITLSITLCHFPPFTPLSRASSMRSVHTEGSAQLHRARTSPPRSSSGTVRGCSSSCASFTLPPSCLPLLHAHYDASPLLRRL